MEIKKILAVHDMSCHGAASLGIAIPILTAAGHKVIALPSVILSSTTDIDQDPVALSTTKWMSQVVKRWKKQNLKFDAIYTGWLGDPTQIPIICELCEQPQNKNAMVLIDPVMGDNGILYPSQQELAKVINELVKHAHVITPNPTEAALLAGLLPKDFNIADDGTIAVEMAHELANALSEQYPRALSIIKSVVSKNRIGVCIKYTSDNTANVKNSVTKEILGERAPAPSMGGTGDLFASLLIARWLKAEISKTSSHVEKNVVIRSVIETMSGMMKSVGVNQIDLPFRNLLSCN